MNNLDDLKRALITVLICYHQDQCKITSKAESEISIDLENLSDADEWENIQAEDTDPNELETDLLSLIQQATQQNNTRLTVLQYIFDMILLLNQATLTEALHIDVVALFDKIEHALVEFFTNMQCLNQTPRLQAIPIVYCHQTVYMSGFMLSRSKLAHYLTSLVLEPLGVCLTSDLQSYSTKIERLVSKQKTVFMRDLITEKNDLIAKTASMTQQGQIAVRENELLLNKCSQLSVAHEQLIQDHAMQLRLNIQLSEEKSSLLDEFSQLLVHCRQLEQNSKLVATQFTGLTKSPVMQPNCMAFSASSIGRSSFNLFTALRTPCISDVGESEAMKSAYNHTIVTIND